MSRMLGLVNGVEVAVPTVTDRDERCDYCNRPGCHWTAHGEAVREYRQLTQPNGNPFSTDDFHTYSRIH